MNKKKFVYWLLLPLFIMLLVAGCTAQLTPQVSYQGRLTDDGGAPLSGAYTLIFRLYDDANAGTELYAERDSVMVQDGLFDTVVGPGAAVAGLLPEDLAQPLWLEVTVGNGTITETLTPRQRLYGAPYAFTLMPGAVVSSTMSSTLYGSNGINGVMSVHNSFDGSTSDPALPTLHVVGEAGLELTSPTNDDGTIYSDLSQTGSDLFIYSQDNIQFYLDDDDNELGTFYVAGNTGNCSIDDSGDLSCSGTKSAVVSVQDEQRRMYAVESPEVWFEDFGAAQLENGAAVVAFDPLFAETITLDDYHVFLTPLGDCQGLYVSEKTADGFTVRELGRGTADVAFDYRIVAHRKNYEDVRLEPNTSGTSDIEEAGQ